MHLVLFWMHHILKHIVKIQLDSSLVWGHGKRRVSDIKHFSAALEMCSVSVLQLWNNQRRTRRGVSEVSRHSLALRERRECFAVCLCYCLEEVRFVSGIGEEVDEGYLETNTNLVSVVSTLSLSPPTAPAILVSIMGPKCPSYASLQLEKRVLSFCMSRLFAQEIVELLII